MGPSRDELVIQAWAGVVFHFSGTNLMNAHRLLSRNFDFNMPLLMTNGCT
jgi:hypothetical protein